MTGEDRLLESELRARHDDGRVLTEKMFGLFTVFCTDQNLPLTMTISTWEVSLHRTEFLFEISEKKTGARWRIFPTIFLRSRPDRVTEYSLFVDTGAGRAIVQDFENLEAFFEAVGYHVLKSARGAPQLRDERRAFPRYAEMTPTLVISPSETRPLTATILNRSREGLMLQLAGEKTLPETFVVVLDGQLVDCAKAWQQGKMAGVRLI